VSERLSALRAWLSGRSLRARVSIAAAIGVAVAVALTSAAAYLTVRNALLDQVDERLLQRATAAIGGPLTRPDALSLIPAEAFGAADLKIALVRADGQFTSAGGVPVRPLLSGDELAVARGQREMSLRTTTVDGEPYRVVAVPAEPGVALVLAQPTEATDQTLNRLGLVTLGTGLAGIVIAATIGSAVARTALRPVRRLTAAAEHVAATQQLDAIPVVGSDEIARLTQAFNAMLNALADAQARQRQLVADAGHELRTPLTSLRTNLDLLAQSDAAGGLDPEDRSQLLSDVRAQLEEMSTLVTDLVELSREDSPQEALAPVDLADLTRRAVARVRRRAPDVTFSVDLRPWPLEGDPQLLARAITNMLDNAAKWSPPDGTVEVSLRDGELTVTDDGPGFAEEDLPHVFERFYRSTQARALPGSGLGLAIVRQAARRHGGVAAAANGEHGGARLSLRVPGSDPSGGDDVIDFGAPADSPHVPDDSWRPLGSLSGSSQTSKKE